jgi:MoaA/NifB/PqqE/SkfB family radical SAM enzyme
MVMFGIFKKKENKNNNSISPEILREYNRHRPLGPQKLACHAPFKNLYFGHHGNVVACCYNRNYILGQYPAMSIKEIWTGKNAQQLREYIKNNDLTLGCQYCEALLKAKNFDAVKSKQYDTNAFNANGYPSVLEFELSNTCNLECVMCSGDFSSMIRARREKLPPLKDAYDLAFVDQLEEFIPHLEEIKFYGGEPFLIEIYYEVWERVKKLNPGLRLSVQTNGTTLNSRVKEIMEHTMFNINISLDSLQKENYERIRKNASFERVMENIEYFYNYCRSRNTFFGISVCGMKQNWKEIPDFVKYCNEMDVPLYIHTVFNPAEYALVNSDPEELKQISAYLQQFDFPANTPTQKKNRTHYMDFTAEIIAWSKTEKKATEQPHDVSMDELVENLLQHIRKSVFVEENLKAEKMAAVKLKFKAVANRPEYLPLKAVLSRVDVTDYKTRDDTIRYFEQHSLDELLEIAKKRAEAGN